MLLQSLMQLKFHICPLKQIFLEFYKLNQLDRQFHHKNWSRKGRELLQDYKCVVWLVLVNNQLKDQSALHLHW